MGAFEDAARLDRKNELDLSYYCATAPLSCQPSRCLQSAKTYGRGAACAKSLESGIHLNATFDHSTLPDLIKSKNHADQATEDHDLSIPLDYRALACREQRAGPQCAGYRGYLTRLTEITSYS